MKTKTIIRVFFAIMILLPMAYPLEGAASGSNIKKTIPLCDKHSQDQFKEGLSVDPKNLPKLVLAARQASFFSEEIKTGSPRLKAFQSFTHPESQIECASTQETEKDTIQFTAPVLIDLTEEHSVGNSVWQFNLMIDGQKLGLWNQASKLLSKDFNFKEWLRLYEKDISFYQISHDQYQIVFKQQDRAARKYLIITYDLVNSIQANPP